MPKISLINFGKRKKEALGKHSTTLESVARTLFFFFNTILKIIRINIRMLKYFAFSFGILLTLVPLPEQEITFSLILKIFLKSEGVF